MMNRLIRLLILGAILASFLATLRDTPFGLPRPLRRALTVRPTLPPDSGDAPKEVAEGQRAPVLPRVPPAAGEEASDLGSFLEKTAQVSGREPGGIRRRPSGEPEFSGQHRILARGDASIGIPALRLPLTTSDSVKVLVPSSAENTRVLSTAPSLPLSSPFVP
jgi:hypothetical protein